MEYSRVVDVPMTPADETSAADAKVEVSRFHAALEAHRRTIGGVGAAIFLLLIVHNLAWLRVNERSIECGYDQCRLAAASGKARPKAPPILSWLSPKSWQRPCGYFVCTQPRDLAQVAARNKHDVVRGQEQIYYYLSEEIPGARLTIPDWMEEHRWYLERVSRLRVEVSTSPLLVAPERLDSLVAAKSVQREWLRKKGSRKKRVWQTIYMFFDDTASDYVLAESGGMHDPLFLLPRARFDSVAAPSGDGS